MPSSIVGNISPREPANPSSSHDNDMTLLDDSDNDDPVATFNRDRTLLGDDPLTDFDGEVTTFKRKQKQSGGLGGTMGLSSFLSPFSRKTTSPPANGSSPGTETPASNDGLIQNGNPRDGDSGDSTLGQPKDGNSLDWVIEGPGRRVGYEDMTAIDWIFEYTKERQRLRVLYSNASGIIGYAREMADASQIWIVLVLTGIAVGLIAAGIDITSGWLGDIKEGYCSAGKDGGRFYLNKNFCCWGYEEWSKCQDWVPWSSTLHVASSGGKWFVEYFFFILYSVSIHLYCRLLMPC
jgi:chloride channel 3/4/5